MRWVLLLCTTIALGAAAPAGSVGFVSPCKAAQLRGTFAVVPGSGAAGHISYALRLRDASSRTCWVSGIPGLRLLDRRGRALPTRVVPARRGMPVVRVVLRHGSVARATARFSPTVSGPGEPANRQCERTARSLRVTPNGGGSLRASIRPPTPVCEHGRMVFSVLSPQRFGTGSSG